MSGRDERRFMSGGSERGEHDRGEGIRRGRKGIWFLVGRGDLA